MNRWQLDTGDPTAAVAAAMIAVAPKQRRRYRQRNRPVWCSLARSSGRAKYLARQPWRTGS